MTEYFVVCRAQSGVRFGKEDPLLLHQFPTSVGPVDILIKTRLAPAAGFTKPVPMGLMAEVRGTAPSLDDALQAFSRAVNSLCPVLVFIGNSPIEDMAPEIGYDISPGVPEREYFQQFLPEERLLFVERRRISAELIARVLRALIAHADAERLRRALGQYYQALRNWEPGLEVLALAHLWMGVEALTPVVLRRTLETRACDRAALAATWNVEERHLDAEVRKRLVMHDDAEAYKRAKAASDGFEHGFLGFAQVHAHSDAVRVKVAAHLRHSILDELGLDAADASTIAAAPYDVPGHLHSTKYLRGRLLAPTDALAATGQAYPYLQWRTVFRDVSDPATDDVMFKMEETFTGQFAEGVAFKPTRIEVWGGQESAVKPVASKNESPGTP